ncbi:MAG: MAPEG family protein [Pseudomonadota bacterium]
MTTTLTILAWTLVLAIVQIALAGAMRTRETGIGYNMGARDDAAPPPGKITARLQRAQANLFETLPLFAAAVLIAHVAGRESDVTVNGAMLYLGARVVYVPVYAAGIPVLRTLVWAVSLVGLVMIVKAILA